jgi:hypothetical protein
VVSWILFTPKIKVVRFALHKFAAVTLLTLLFLLGCGSGSPPPPVPPAAPDIYVAGVELAGNFYKAVYWKNGLITHLDSGVYGARATGIAVANGHVYVSGYVGSVAGGYNRATIWTDGIASSLVADDRQSTATSVIVVGQDVFVGGCEAALPGVGTYSATAEYWKNGFPVALETNQEGGCVTALTASGSDLYVLGSIVGHTEIGPNSFADVPIVTVWKNMTKQELTDGTTFTTSSGITVSNGHVYVSGSLCASLTPDCSSAAFWVDGTVSLITPATLAQASGIAVIGSTTYTAVNAATTSGGNLAELSTDTVVTPLASDSSSGTSAVAAYGNDVYVVGYDAYGSCYWKNGQQTYLVGAMGGNDQNLAVAMVIVPAG